MALLLCRTLQRNFLLDLFLAMKDSLPFQNRYLIHRQYHCNSQTLKIRGQKQMQLGNIKFGSSINNHIDSVCHTEERQRVFAAGHEEVIASTALMAGLHRRVDTLT